ncbi:MAG: excinuclease ABC subunit UvrA, partial [Patescibacteria group bacterium]
MSRKSQKEISQEIMALPNNTQIAVLARVKNGDKTSREIIKSVMQLGYARVRFNGKIMLSEQAIQIASEQVRSDIDIVVDRIILNQKNPDKERILDSIETALKLGGGSLIVFRDNEEDLFFNRYFICQECQFKLEEVTPKNFSFNSPYGACDFCSGLGVIQEVEEDLVVPNKNLSLIEGAIMPWSKSLGRNGANNNNFQILKSLGEELGFSLDDPVKKISPAAWQTVLYGTKSGEVNLRKNDWGGIKQVRTNFPGVISMLKKKYQEASSEYVRSEIEKYMIEKTCPICQGKRLRPESLAVYVDGKSIDDICKLPLSEVALLGKSIKLENETQKSVAVPLIREIEKRSQALSDVGLEYLSLSRGSNTISGGEAQRIRLATQLNSQLMGVTYVLDEPSIGLHDRDTEKLIKTLHLLKDGGNSLLVVEHDEKIIQEADWIIDMGPGAGEEGGEVIFSGGVGDLLNSKNSTAQYLSGKKKVSSKKNYRKGSGRTLEITGISEHNLKNIDVEIPLGKLVVVTGVSGSGKSTLVNDVLAKILAKHFYKAKELPGKYRKIKGLEHIDKVINIDQSPIGRTPRSNAATYTGVFSLIRDIFAGTEESKKRNYNASRFSFNMKGGRCEDCQGDGTKKIEMHLLPDMYVRCETCQGRRYNQGTLEIEYQGVNVADVLEMSVSYALRFFSKSPAISEKLQTLENVGLGYLKLGQSATNLSGGEAQRIKLATELSRKQTGKTLYILDEPTIGLHFEDIKKLLGVLDALVEKGNTVLVVEHNKDVIRSADWVIDLGPEGGNGGGEVVFSGTPEKLKKC